MTTTTLFWEFASAALGIAMGLLASPGLPAAQNPPQAVVGVAPVEVREITADTEFVGRVEAINSVDIRARVTGVIQDRPFQEGQLVRKGDLLYLIERAPYEAALAGAKAALARAQATERNAHRALQRAQQLARTGTATQVALEQAKTTYESAVANSGTADANLRQAQLNLDYTRITSPIDGRIGQAAYSIGSLVTPSSNPLARVVQVDPIRVVFSVSDRILLHLRQSQQRPTLEQLSAEFIPTLRLSTGTTYGSEGRIEFVGNEVDPQRDQPLQSVFFSLHQRAGGAGRQHRPSIVGDGRPGAQHTAHGLWHRVDRARAAGATSRRSACNRYLARGRVRLSVPCGSV